MKIGEFELFTSPNQATVLIEGRILKFHLSNDRNLAYAYRLMNAPITMNKIKR
jgi:hypothetical protein